jgi:hypothetical protein
MDEEHIQPIKENANTGGDTQKPESKPPVASVNVSKIDPPQNTQTSDTDIKRRKRKPLSCFEIWTIALASLGILVAAGTGGAIFWQARISARTLVEIKKGGTDTHDLAVAAKIQSDKMSNMADAADKIRQAAENMVIQDQKIADNSQKALDASNIQSKAALDASIAASRNDQRAWVAQIGMGSDAPEVGKVMKGFVTWNNSGKTFAKQVKPLVHFGFVPAPIPDDTTLTRYAGFSILPVGSIGVLAPNGQYKTPLETKAPIDETDKDRISGTWYTYIWGEMTYEDIFGHAHNTIFCSSRQGIAGEFIQCPFHNDAN